MSLGKREEVTDSARFGAARQAAQMTLAIGELAVSKTVAKAPMRFNKVKYSFSSSRTGGTS